MKRPERRQYLDHLHQHLQRLRRPLHLLLRLLLFPLIAASILGGAAPLFADEIIRARGKGKPVTKVEITGATYEQVEYRIGTISRRQSVPAEDVERLVFDSEPSSLTRGRGALEQGDYERAIEFLRSAATLQNKLHRGNAMYLIGRAHLLWGERDPSHFNEAVRAFKAYIKALQVDKHFYLPHATLDLAQAHMRLGNHAEAEQALEGLAAGRMGRKWTAGAKLGKAAVRLAQGKFADARRLYGDLNADPAVVASHDFRLQAQLGYARCQIGQKQYRAAAETVKEKILQAKRTETPRLDHYRAQAWIIWGIADEGLATGDREKLEWALIHYLRGAILAGSGNREDLAEALYRAKEIWKRLGQDERAEELKQRLSKLCPDSPWNK